MKVVLDGRNGKSRSSLWFCLTALCVLSLIGPGLSFGAKAEKKIKPRETVSVQKDVAVTDANIQAYQKKVEELVKKGDFEGSLKILLKIHNYTKEVLTTVKFVKTEYDKAVNDSSTPQNAREDLLIKLKGLNQLIPRYTTLYEASVFNLGYVYSKTGDTEKARIHFVEYLQLTPFSTKPDSKWMKAKKLLLELYSLEGEF